MVVFVVWFLVAVVAGVTGRVAALRPPAPQLVLLGLTVGLILLERVSVKFRAVIAAVPVRAMVALHLTRFVGIAFLVLAGRGALSPAFAIPAGWGDIGVAGLAGLLLLSGVSVEKRRGWYVTWNVLGSIDLLFVVLTALRMAMADPDAMQGLLVFPMSLVPTFLVPVLLASHVWIFRRLGRVGGSSTYKQMGTRTE